MTAKPIESFSVESANALFSARLNALPHLLNDATDIARETDGIEAVAQFDTYTTVFFSRLYKRADVFEDLQIALSQGLDVPEAFKESESDA